MSGSSRPPEPSLGAFGEKLRQQRERQGISLDAISNSTKIRMHMLRALEEEHFEQLPGGVFNKGFVRAYARHIGLDEEETIAEYLDALRESQVRQQEIMPDLRAGTNKPPAASEPPTHLDRHPPADTSQADPADQADRAAANRQPVLSMAGDSRSASHVSHVGLDTEPAIGSVSPGVDSGQPDARSSIDIPYRSIPWMKLVFALALAIVVLAFWNFIRRHEGTAVRYSQAPSQQSASANSTSQSAQPQALTTPGAQKQASPSLSAAASRKTASEPPNKTRPIPSAPMNAAAGTSATEAALKPISPVAVPANDVILTPKKDASVAQSATFTLLIRAEKTTWVSIVADGRQVAQEFLIAPAHTSVRATKEITVKAGNAAGIVFELNGKQVGEPGADGEVKTYVFDANGIEPGENAPSPDP